MDQEDEYEEDEEDGSVLPPFLMSLYDSDKQL